MCLAVPTRVKEIDGAYAEVETGGVSRKVSIALTPEVKAGDYVLIHAGYPWLEEAACMANILPNVFLDISLSCPATGGALRENLLKILEMAPFTKVLYGSDGLTIPEVAWVSAHLIRQALGEVLSELVDRSYLSRPRALEAGRRILWQNAHELYANVRSHGD